MIHDASVEVTCDNERCKESAYVELHMVYLNNNPNGGVYDHRDKAIERDLKRDHEWIVKDGKHFCSEECAESDNTQPAPV